jgi:hypothetical protein
MFNKISSAMSSSMESTYLGRGLKKLFTNIGNFIYHVVRAAQHLIVGVASAALILAKGIIGCTVAVLSVNAAVFMGSTVVMYASLKSAFSELKGGVFACGKSIFAAVKSLVGFHDPVEGVSDVNEKQEYPEEFPLIQEESQLILSEEARIEKATEKVDLFFKGLDELSRIEKEHNDSNPNADMIVDTYEEEIKNSLFTMYTAAKEVVALVFTPLPQQQQQLADNSSRMRIEQEPDSPRTGLTYRQY